MQKLLDDLMVTAELCGTSFSEAAAAVLVSELNGYPPEQIHGALKRCRREIKGRLSLADIIDRLDDGRPGVEEAWGMLPKDEYGSAALSDEMREAMGACWSMIESDPVAARMTFKEVYTSACRKARMSYKPANWKMSLGWDKGGREGAYADAIAQGRLTMDHAIAALGHEAAERIGEDIGYRQQSLPNPVSQRIEQIGQLIAINQ